ncbi:hypothetical protein OOZ63_09700 [Paucibacter sp. PLA-PC-4]|uniref:hypothetical protein n=1 Tax=Paucibacter sp. PLA-PC-4 TaxID=2993655 RepID=UPI002248BC5A|nr:hypothetical protein [Paucibacter sp. PLA-PC-4]MCX2862115.1 hypothetical protein [Paucibacter sp. PLA-PC-4]
MSLQSPAAGITAQGQRFDMYGPIHKALRHLFCDTLVRMGRLDWQDPAELAEVSSQLDGLLTLLRQHLQHENDFIHTFMQSRQPGSAERAGGEHHDHLQALAALALEVKLLRKLPSAAQAAGVYRQLSLLMAENLMHMDMEESEHHLCLWQQATDEELMALHDRLLASIPPAEMFETLAWMLPALSPQQRAGMLTGMREGAPPPVFQAVLDLAKEKLDARAWAKLQAALRQPLAA